jgi:hypothetical protein
MIRGLIDRHAAGSFTLTEQGRAATRSWQLRSGVIRDLIERDAARGLCADR